MSPAGPIALIDARDPLSNVNPVAPPLPRPSIPEAGEPSMTVAGYANDVLVDADWATAHLDDPTVRF
ncbi:MAG TPA: hypothetical protein VN773_07075, partial [Verrucomicrobiae bacterium]|nr:hypothetical protein [Verrucomicrobiae bacterium]